MEGRHRKTVSQGRTLRVSDVAAYLGVSQQRAAQMHAEGKFPEPERIDGIGPLWKPGHDRAVGQA
jgi:predicted DNA-binding transcriptional regulator AlpA